MGLLDYDLFYKLLFVVCVNSGYADLKEIEKQKKMF